MAKYSENKCRYCVHLSSVSNKDGKSPWCWGNAQDFRRCMCMSSPCHGRLRCVGNQPRALWDRACKQYERKSNIDVKSTHCA